VTELRCFPLDALPSYLNNTSRRALDQFLAATDSTR